MRMSYIVCRERRPMFGLCEADEKDVLLATKVLKMHKRNEKMTKNILFLVIQIRFDGWGLEGKLKIKV